MDNIAHPLAHLGQPPYRFAGYQECVYRACHDAPAQPGASCDYCGTGIRHVYWFQSSDGRNFKLGCDCAEKGRVRTGAEWKALKREMHADRREYERKAAREAREAREREENDGMTLAELRAVERQEREAEWAREREEKEAQRAAERAASRHVGTIGERRTFELTYVFSTSWESAYGVQRLTIMQDGEGNFFKHVSSGEPIARKGQTVRVKARIKDHSEYEGCQQTVLTRPGTASKEILKDEEMENA